MYTMVRFLDIDLGMMVWLWMVVRFVDCYLRLTNGYRCATGVYVYVDVLYVSLEGT